MRTYQELPVELSLYPLCQSSELRLETRSGSSPASQSVSDHG